MRSISRERSTLTPRSWKLYVHAYHYHYHYHHERELERARERARAYERAFDERVCLLWINYPHTHTHTHTIYQSRYLSLSIAFYRNL